MLSAIIVAAGKGTRLGGVKKQFLNLNGCPVLMYSVKKFAELGADEIIVVVAEEDLEMANNLCSPYSLRCKVVAGGSTRQQSVQKGFAACAPDGLVAIHDAARPLVSLDELRAVVNAAKAFQAAALGVAVCDTIKKVNDGTIIHTISRENLYCIQTPQVFEKKLYAAALQQCPSNCTDDCQIVESIGRPIRLVEGSKHNIKITTQADLEYASLALKEGFL